MLSSQSGSACSVDHPRESNRRTQAKQRRIFCYADFVPLKTCVVRFADGAGVNHETEVQAESLFEAAALALRGFGADDWSAEGIHWTGVLEVIVQQPAVKHKILLDKFHAFLNGKGGSPREITTRQKLNQIMDRK